MFTKIKKVYFKIDKNEKKAKVIDQDSTILVVHVQGRLY